MAPCFERVEHVPCLAQRRARFARGTALRATLRGSEVQERARAREGHRHPPVLRDRVLRTRRSRPPGHQPRPRAARGRAAPRRAGADARSSARPRASSQSAASAAAVRRPAATSASISSPANGSTAGSPTPAATSCARSGPESRGRVAGVAEREVEQRERPLRVDASQRDRALAGDLEHALRIRAGVGRAPGARADQRSC